MARYLIIRNLDDDKVKQALHELGGTATPTQVEAKFRQVIGGVSLAELADCDLTAIPDDTRRAYLHGGNAYKIMPDGTIDLRSPSYK